MAPTKRRKYRKLSDLLRELGRGSVPLEDGKVPLSELSIIEQVRKRMTDIAELADSIAAVGLLEPIIVGAFDWRSGQDYIRAHAKIWECEPQRDRVIWVDTDEGRKRAYIVIAGHRRVTALRHLWDQGCTFCHEQYGAPTEPGECYRRHFNGEEEVRAQFCYNPTPLEAFLKQINENVYIPPPPHENAHSWRISFRILREFMPNLSISAFAGLVGRSAQTVANGIRYTELPEAVQDAVEVGSLPYGVALELERLYRTANEHKRKGRDEGVTEAQLLDLVGVAVSKRWTVAEARQRVKQRLGNIRDGQRSLFEVMEPGAEAMFEKQQRRLTVAAGMGSVLARDRAYLALVANLLGSGALGKDDSPFSIASPTGHYRGFAERMGELLGPLLEHLPKGERDRIARVILASLEGTDGIMEQIEDKLTRKRQSKKGEPKR